MLGTGSYDDDRCYKVKISELLEKLKKNRDAHVAIVEEAQAEFRRQAIKRLDAMLLEAQSGKRISMSVGLSVPTQHTDAFDNAIGIMEMTARAGEKTIDITAREYERFVRNNWEWSQGFRASNGTYTSTVL